MIRVRVLLLMSALGLAACRAAPGADGVQPEVELAFEGEEHIGEDSLREAVLEELGRWGYRHPTKAAVDDAAFALELFYHARGFPWVRVEYEYESEPGVPVRARFRITEGVQTSVRELFLEGIRALDPPHARSFFGQAAEGGVYDAEALETSVAALRRFYRDEGHLRARVEPPEVTFSDDGSEAGVVVRVFEGPRFVIAALSFEGGIPAMREREQGLASHHAGRAYVQGAELELRSALRADYARRGYPDCEVSVEDHFDEETGEVRIHLRVVPGPRVTIGGIVIAGNERTRDSAIRTRLGIASGTLYDEEQVQDAFRELYETGLFESIRIELEGQGSERVLRVEVVEVRAVEISVEPGWGSYEGPRLRLAVEEKNFAGRGQRVTLEGIASPLAQSARVGWIDPFFLGTRLTAESSVFAERRQEPSFEFSRVGARFFLRRRWDDEWTSSVGYEFRPTDVTDDDVAMSDELAREADVASILVSTVYDSRNNLLLPTRGRRALASLEWADDGLGSPTEFLRGQLELMQLFRLPWETSLAASARGGMIAPAGQTDEIPLPERFFNGGEASVRSFREDELGPKDSSGDPIGGEGATTLNLELRRPIIGNLGAALFADAGNVALDVQDYLDFDGFRFAVGVGLRYSLPIGPLRIDLGVNPNPLDDEDEYVLHFSVGYPY